MGGAIPPLPQYTFMVWCSFIAQGQLYLYLVSVVRLIKFRRLRWAKPFTQNSGDNESVQNFDREISWKRPVGRSSTRWEDKMKMDL
jgi:hypothetical protein